MDTGKILRLFYATNEEPAALAKKFMAAETFCLLDISWWWDPHCSWNENRSAAIKMLSVLTAENCCERIDADFFIKTPVFIEWLERTIRVDELLKDANESR